MNSQNALRLAFVLALAMSLPAAGAAATHSITQSGFTFAPDSLNIAVGDTVEDRLQILLAPQLARGMPLQAQHRVDTGERQYRDP